MREPLFTDTVTLYNYHRDATRTDRWQRTVLRGVQYKEKTETSATETGLSMHTSVSLTIPVNVDAGGRRYLPKEVFAVSDSKEVYWTLSDVKNQDAIVLGDCPAEITEDYPLSSLKKEYGFVTIAAVRDNTLRRFLKHLRAVCV